MKSTFLLLCAVFLAISASAAILPTHSSPVLTAKEVRQGYREHVVLARPRTAHRGTIDDEEARDGIAVRERFSRFGDLRVITLGDNDTADAAIARLRATGRYEFVEPDYIRYIKATPNDPKFADGSLWGLSNTGQRGNVEGIAVNGVAGADIGAVAAWDIIHDAPNVIVAVVDTGISLTHQDIVGNLWTNPDPTNNDIHGANFVGGAGRMESGNPADDEGHGTHVAGTIGAVGNNGTGSVGVAWKVQLMAVKVMGSNGQGNSSDIIAGIDYAIAHGAAIINASFGADAAAGTTGYSSSELAAITSARSAGVIFVAAAGNAQPPSYVPVNLDVSRAYPASFPLDNVVTVGASNRRDQVASFSYYGAAVDLYAPGDDIVSLDYATTSGTISMDGTSMAAPHVAGALALLKAQFPGETYRQLINRLLRGVDRGTAFVGKSQTGGRLNVYRALTTTTNRPFNDDFADRPHFNTDNLSIRSNNDGAQPDGPGILGFPASHDLWWEWTAPASGSVTVSTSGSSYDTLLAIYTGTAANALTLVAANDDDNGAVTSRAKFTAQAGTTYEIAVDGKNGLSGLTMVSLGTTPAHDAFATPYSLSGESVQLTGTNLHCSREVGEPAILGFAGGNSLWYQWTAPRSGRFQVSASSVEFDPILAVYTGTALTSLTLVSASDNTGSDNAQTAALCTIDATAGTTYRITVDSKIASTSGQFKLTLVDSLWQATTGNSVTCSPAVASDGTVYVGSTDKTFYAFAPDGSQKWTIATGGPIDTCSAAIADDGTVYFGSWDGNLYAVSPSGSLLWKHQIGASTVDTAYSPAIGSDGTIYTRASDGYLHALRASDGSEIWEKSIVAAATSFYGNPVVGGDGTIYEGSDETDHKFTAFNPDGSIKWTQSIDSGVYGAPAIDGHGNVYFTTLSGGVYSFSATGTQRWYTTSGGNISSSVALSADGGTLYYAGYDAKLYARDTATGNIRWQFTLGAEVRASSPAIDANGVVYIGCYDNKLYAVNPDGTQKRVYDTGDVIRSAPAIAGTRLYFGSNDQKLYAFDLAAGPSSSGWSQYRANPRRLGRAVATGPVPPTITTAPGSQSALTGSTVTFTIAATGSPTVQWQKDGVNLANGGHVSGATGLTLTLANIGSADAGNYTAVLTNAGGTVTSDAATLTIGSAANPGRIINMSVLTSINADENFTFGYYLGGAGTSGSKPMLMRAMGPSLVAYQVSPVLPNPYLEFYLGSTLTATNDDWNNDPAIASVASAVQAFPFVSATSKDAAVFAPNVPQSGQHSIKVFSHDNGSGFVIAELYDATSSNAWTTATPRLINVSVMKNVGTLTTVGFNITGSTSVKVLVRAVGPTLASLFGMTGTMADPKIALYSQSNTSTPLDTNDDWGGGATLQAAFTASNAFGLTANSKDAALLKTLSSGGYSVQVSAASGATGTAIIEVYEVP